MGLGTVPLGGLYSPVQATEALDLVRQSHASGINYFDTAPQYGSGLAERRLAKVLPDLPRDEIVVATKVGRLIRPVTPASTAVRVMRESISNRDVGRFARAAGKAVKAVGGKLRGGHADAAPLPDDATDPRLGSVYDFSYDGAMRSLEESLERLGLDRIDVLLIHDPDYYYPQAISGAYRALEKLRAEGTVRAIGVGMNQSAMLARFAREGDFDCFLVAGRYTLLDQGALVDLLPEAERRGASIIVGGVYNSGILADPRPGAHFDYAPASPAILDRAMRMQTTCARHGVPLKAAAVQFPLGHPAVASVLAGPRSQAEVEENAAMLAFPIPDDLWAELKHEGLLPDDVPTPRATPAGDPRMAAIAPGAAGTGETTEAGAGALH